MTKPIKSNSPTSSVADTSFPGAPVIRRLRLHLSGEVFLLAGLCVYVLALSVVPLGRLLLEGLRPGEDGTPLGLFAEVWSSRSAPRALANTLVASLGATAVSVLLGAGMAVL